MMFTNLKIATIGTVVMAAFSLSTLAADAAGVFLVGDSNVFTASADNEIFLQNVFNNKNVANYGVASLDGLGTTATETLLGGSFFPFSAPSTITSANLAGNDYAIFGPLRDSVSASELIALNSFVSGGGSLFLTGEGNDAFVETNRAINQILTAVGSSMSLSLTTNFDNSPFGTSFNATTSGEFGNGVNTWNSGFASSINLGKGTAVVAGSANLNVFGTAVAYEDLRPAPSPVPAPAGLPLLASGAIALMALLRRRRAG